VKHRWKAGLALALVLAGLVGARRYLLHGQHERGYRPSGVAAARSSTRPVFHQHAAPRAVPSSPPPEPPPPLPALPASLRDTDVDGALHVDSEGNLLLDPEVLSLFDYFLTATGEEPEEVIRARIVAAIRERVDTRAADQAVALLDRYLDYRADARGRRAATEAEPAALLAALKQLRRDHFGEPAASQLFGMEERETEVAIEEGRITADAALSPEEREARLAEVEATLPDATREARAEARRPLREQAEDDALRAAGATDEELYEHRVATVGVEAADRLAELDRQRAAWNQRVDAFREERDLIEATVPDVERRRSEEEVLLVREFTPEERLRVRAILSLKGGVGEEG
jgi:lipase chaperone LimK